MSEPQPELQYCPDDGTRPAEPEPQPDDGTRQKELLPQQRSAPQLGVATPERRDALHGNMLRCQSCSTAFIRRVGFHGVQDSWSLPSTPSKLTHQLSASPLHRTMTAREQAETDIKISYLERGQRAVTQEVYAEDLTATMDDQLMKGKDVDWSECLVTGPLWDQLTEKERLEYKRLVALERQSKVDEADAPPHVLHTPRPGPRRLSRPSEAGGASRSRQSAPFMTSSWGSSTRHLNVGAERAGDAIGGHGKVVRAVWKGSLKVAIKVVLTVRDNTEETRLLMDLRHPNLVACYGVLNQEWPDKSPKHSIVTERCTTNLGAFLHDHSRWQKLGPDQIDERKYTILEHVSQGLQKLHDMSVLHRDLKAENILLDGAVGECEQCHHSGTWKICDLGEAKILQAPVLSFRRGQPWKGQFDLTRFVKVTAESLRNEGAKSYCWLHPGEYCKYSSSDKKNLRQELKGIGKGEKSWRPSDFEELKARARGEGLTTDDFKQLRHAAGQRALKEHPKPEELSEAQRMSILKETDLYPEDIIEAILRHHDPYPYGALVFSCSEDSKGAPTKADWVFAVAAPIGSSCANPTYDLPSTLGDSKTLDRKPAHEMRFPDALKPFNLIPAAELNEELTHHVHIDLERSTYRISKPGRHSSKWPPQVSTLFSLYQDTRPFLLLLNASKKFSQEELHDKSADQLRRLCEAEEAIKASDIETAQKDSLRELEGQISRPHPIGSMGALERQRQCIPRRKYDQNVPYKGGVPLQATHYVCAYQLPQWRTDHLSARQLKDFSMYSGEVSLASYGGFIYLNITEETHVPDGWNTHYSATALASGKPRVRVVGVTAFSTGPRPQYPGGVVSRSDDDDNITRSIASPELWNRKDIGLETDVYAFGIIMWEIFSRTRAWHWRDGVSDYKIKNLVLKKQMRPKIPIGMHKNCAKMIRRCLHTNPGRRPVAKQLTDWLRQRREGLQQQIRWDQSAKVREREMMGQSSALRKQQHWVITDRRSELAKRWHHGKYSRHYFTETRQEDDSIKSQYFRELTINVCYSAAGCAADWEERALADELCQVAEFVPGSKMWALRAIPVREMQRTGSKEKLVTELRRGDSFKILKPLINGIQLLVEIDPVDTVKGGASKVVIGWIRPVGRHGHLLVTKDEPEEDNRPFGTKFTLTDKAGNKTNHWPKIVRIDQHQEVKKSMVQTLAPEFPEIQVGCKLVEINGRPTPDEISKAKQMLAHRPLRLKFSVPEQPRQLAPWPTSQWPSADRSDQPTDFRVDPDPQRPSGYRRKQNEDWVQAGLPRWIEAGLEGVEMVTQHERLKERSDLTQALDEIEELKRQLAAK